MSDGVIITLIICSAIIVLSYIGRKKNQNENGVAMEYKILRSQLDDKKFYERTLGALNDRIQSYIDTKLGLKGMSYEEVKVQKSSFDDKFTTTFAHLESLDQERDFVKEQLRIIDNYLQDIDRMFSAMNSKEKEVFKLKYFYGKTEKEMSIELNVCEKTISRTVKKILEKL